jgi:hypothetical protein
LEEDARARTRAEAPPRVVPRAARGIVTRPAGVVARDMSRREVEVMLDYLSTYLSVLSVLSVLSTVR